ncbi:MAG: hypothetical protein HC933_04485 [Pleurocapsa sp. SU_196_0]|nr:hypothetical protein [Pleurocapsa sp. SU_196_0]
MKTKYTLDSTNTPVEVNGSETDTAKIIARDEVHEVGFLVTQFLGVAVIPPSYDQKRKGLSPLFFETVFTATSTKKKQKLERYRTWSEAIAGHRSHYKQLLEKINEESSRQRG